MLNKVDKPDAEPDRALNQEGPELEYKVVEAMTTNETSFFRDWHPFECLKNQIVPELIRLRDHTRKLRIWSAACSTGQEAYSLVMLLRDHFPQLSDWEVEILGTDLSLDALSKAEAATYRGLEVNRGLPAPLLLKHFDRNGGSWRLKTPLRESVRFRQHNLIGDWSVIGKERFDLILLRNVLIYFDAGIKKQILGRLRDHLADDGYLFLGSSETVAFVDDTYERAFRDETTACYQPRTR
ncbi:MAG: protein-glutamate O-methyltransferase CheR [Myxococcota bacterium]